MSETATKGPEPPPFVTLSLQDYSNPVPYPSDAARMKTPPPIKANLPAPDTPVAARSIYAKLSEGGDLDTRKDRLLEDIGPIQEYNLDTMLKMCFPKLPDDFVMPSDDELKAAKLISEDGRWVYFPVDPKESDLVETAYFDKLEQLCQDITKLSCFMTSDKGKVQKPSLSDLKASPSKAPLSARKHYKHRPDFFFVLKDRRSINTPPGSTSWLDIFCCGEAKKGDSKIDMIDNMLKLIWSCTNAMRFDLSRRLTYGITIENRKLRLWVFSRAAIMVSSPFEWVQDHSRFIKLVFALSYAQKHQAGFSQVITPFKVVKKTVIYEIVLKGKVYYTTGRVLSEFRARRLLGRGTRVLEVYQPHNPSVKFALKIYWQVLTDPYEGKQIIDLRAEAVKEHLPVNDFLVKVQDYGAIGTTRQSISADDTTASFLPSNQLHPIGHYWVSNPRLADANNPGDGSHYGVGQMPGQTTGDRRVDAMESHRLKPSTILLTPIRHRKHVFVLIDDIGSALHDLHEVHGFMRALQTGVKSVQHLHQLKFVHRDISTGNFLVCADGKVKLMDLEYMKDKRIETSSGEEMRTGTAQFIAHEVQAGMYGYTPGAERPFERQFLSPEDSLATAYDDAKVAVKKRKLEERKDPPLVYNMLHDLESCYWILLWFFILHVPSHALVDFNPAAQRTFSLEVFPEERVILPAPRCAAIARDSFIEEMFSKVHYDVKEACAPTQTVAKMILFSHKAMQSTATIPTAIHSNLYDGFIEQVDEILTKVSNHPMEFISDFETRQENAGIQVTSFKYPLNTAATQAAPGANIIKGNN